MEHKHNSEFISKLKDYLKIIFQFDCADLDFGIYRIMNYKRKEIERFIEDDLIGVVEKEFKKYKIQNQKDLLERIEKKREEIKKFEEMLGEKILKNGEIEDQFREKPFAKEYIELKNQIDELDITESIQSQVFNDLYSFFTRYYEDGDFISKRRYSFKNYKYAIPYNGEEVKLYWVNFDQYYIKTGEVFKDYEFYQDGWNFIFRTVFADVEANNVKGNRRYFFLSPDEPIKISNKSCLIKFEYRLLTNEDLKQYPVKTKEGKIKATGIKQEDLNYILKDKIVSLITSIEPRVILTESQDKKTILEKHLYKYTRKITSDFFIHKNLKEFLERELDYFIKTEVLDIESFDTDKERYFDRHITRAKVVKNIGKRIIEFLSQIEDYQKMLWEKKKFVLKTDYVITIDHIPEDFYEEILENKEQLKEWQELGFGDIKTKKDFNGKKLPVDTKYFDECFKERLLEKLSEKGNIDDLLDGILIKSENWQALNLILEKYKEKVQTIYIDPPFNTGTNEFLYKNKYLDSSWISMIYDRLYLGRKFLKYEGSIYVRIDYHGNHYIRMLLNEIFSEENFRNEITIAKSKEFFKTMKHVKKFSEETESLFFFSKTPYLKFNLVYRIKDKPSKYESFLPVDDKTYQDYRIINGKKYYSPKGRKWGVIQENIDKLLQEKRLIFEKGKWHLITYKELLKDAWLDYQGYSRKWGFKTENSEIFIKRAIESTSNEGDLVMDFFLGSGTTTAVAHKLKKKWLGIEMGDHFEKVVIPRMKKVLFYDKSGISKEVKNYKGGGVFKYHYLEQYEDTLHNIEFPQEEKGQNLLQFIPDESKTEYLMKYMLKFETEGSPSLLDIQQFENPFEYKLKIISNGKGEEIVNVDLVETFNYLIGLKIDKYKFQKENGRKYVFVFGERDNKKIVIVWRPTKDIDLKIDKEIIEKELTSFNADEIFINGDSFVKDYKPIEIEFKTLMGA